MRLGKLGKVGEDGTFADNFWTWWIALQPPERVVFEGRLSRTSEADWGKMLELCRKSRVLQVMAALLWWGEALDLLNDPIGCMDWDSAVDDVRWACLQMGKAELTG
ncbi:hypothetical protein DFH07DRAFT_726480 [Mycena maculata]|uniref:Uncharacterized protein n=1 Tax=Mycena maculata TaxID=230809 RepID=A0AAD7P2K3_9AGAR|nr:hypothetical protein DFH07DRAFT_726480 [Mycena maculata]